MCWRPNFTFGTLVLGAFPFGAFTFSTFTFITLLPINLALLGANLFSRFVLIEPFKGLFNIIFICVFIPILVNRGFPLGTMFHSTDLAFLGSVMIDPFTSIFRSIFTFGFEFINVFGILFKTVFKSIKIFIPSVMVCLIRLVCMPPTISDHLRLHPPTLWCHSDTHCVSSHNHATPVAGLNLDQCLISPDFVPMSQATTYLSFSPYAAFGEKDK